jgi:hypothetical protein
VDASEAENSQTLSSPVWQSFTTVLKGMYKRVGHGKGHPKLFEVIELSPSGFGVHVPKLVADLYIPGSIEGVVGPKK